MNLTRFSLNHPYVIVALAFLVVSMGVIGYLRTPVDLFPESMPPQVVVVTIQPGAGAEDVKDKITEIIEKELNTLSGLESLRSTSRDQVSSVMAEFRYTKSLGMALLDVQNAIARIRGALPGNASAPRIYRLTSATSRPLMTLALSPKAEGAKCLRDIRLLAENEIKDRILGLDGIADVDVFGGHRPEVQVRLHRDKLAANQVGIGEVIGILSSQNISAPAGTLYTRNSEYLIRTAGEFRHLEDIRRLPVRHTGRGLLRMADLATVELAEVKPRSIYHGNGRSAVAMGIIRPEGGATVGAIKNLKAFMPQLRAAYPDIRFDVTQDQEPLINLNLSGMRLSIIQAIALTVAVIFLFLADLRAALVVSVSIPLAFFFSLGVLWLTPFTLNMVTLTGLIVAIGMVVDASVVGLENIYRHYDGMASPDAKRAAEEGAHQIALAITAGMLTTVAVLVPIMFIGGYPQRTIGRLSFTIAVTLVASLVAALTVVPLAASKLLARRRGKRSLLERAASYTDRMVDVLRRFYLYVLGKALRWRVATLVMAAVLFVLTMRTILPLIGAELMPPMDAGIMIVEFSAPATETPEEMARLLGRVEKVIYEQEGVEMVSSVAGSEMGALSFGAGGATLQSAKITVQLVDRTRRTRDIWTIQDDLRQQIQGIPGIQSARVNEFGATPMATTKAPIDIVVSGPDPVMLSSLADKVMKALKGVPGLVDVRRSWYFDEREQVVTVDPALARFYGTSPKQVSAELNAAVDGVPAGKLRLAHFLDIPIRVGYDGVDAGSLEEIGGVYVGSRFGPVPLRAISEIEETRRQPFVTRENLQATVDVTGVNRVFTVAQVSRKVEERLAKVAVPRGYAIKMSGTVKDMKETQQRLRRSLLIGAVLLYLLLLAMFRSFADPFTILSAIPLAVAGALWGLLLFNKPMSMPGNMGMIFLAGTVINNSVLLLDFILNAQKEGLGRREAILQSVSVRLRPILMTTFSTIIGLSPLVFEMAVGLERMSPLAIVASMGLLIGTFLTMVVVPVIYDCIESAKEGGKKVAKLLFGKA